MLVGGPRCAADREQRRTDRRWSAAIVTLAALVQTAAHVAGFGRTVDSRRGRRARSHTGSRTPWVAPPRRPARCRARPVRTHLDVPKLSGVGVDATTAVPFTVAANGPPVANAGGPYDVLVGDSLASTRRGSFDPEAHPVTVRLGPEQRRHVRRRHFGPASRWSRTRRSDGDRGGTCAIGVALPIAVRVTDDKGAQATAATSVTFHRDFGLTMNPTVDHPQPRRLREPASADRARRAASPNR